MTYPARHSLAIASLFGLALATRSAGAPPAAPPATAPASHDHAHAAPHWTYEGPDGPAHWGDLDPSYQTCKLGHLQSPIDIPASKLKASHLDPIQFDYKPSPLEIVDNGHTVMATAAPGSFIRIGSAEYELQQVHFHRPSEETVDGKHFAMVAHLVHKNKEGALAVVAVLFEEGTPNATLAALFAHLPTTPSKQESPSGVQLDAAKLLPSTTAYYTFSGSLTTPPCTEGVTWYVLRKPATASAGQLAAFAKRYPHNARPTQPLDGREIRESE